MESSLSTPRAALLVLRSCLILLLCSCSSGWGQEEPYYFYHARGYGSESLINPITFILNGSFGILQYPNRSRKIFEIAYAQGFTNVVDNLSHPLYSISKYGWKDFIENELIPGSISRKNAQYWPNYQNHLIGGGMDYVLISEWYRYHGFGSPRLLGIGTMVVYHFLNEVVENGSYDGINVDPLADLLVFDPLGITLFSLPGVPKFFAGTLNMAEWPTQPEYNPFTRTIENNGVNYVMKYRLGESTSLFYYWGLTGLIGLSYSLGDGRAISAGGGLRASQLVNSGDQTVARKLTTDLTWNAGFFYDRENSLLASLFLSGISDYTVHLNLYPGVVALGQFTPGLFCAWGEGGKFVAGLNVSCLPFGLAAGVSE
jgi:hypothetical protein